MLRVLREDAGQRISPRFMSPDRSATTAPVRAVWIQGFLWLLALAPVAFIAIKLVGNLRNIPFWDEYDAILALAVALDEGASGGRLWELLVAVHNEHRMVVSRLLVAGMFWLTGGVNFVALAVVGNLHLVGACGLLLAVAKGAASRARLAAVLGLGLFHLQHHENLFWGGSSIDHFFVVLCAVGAMVALSRPGGWRLAGAIACGVLGTFSLAHGLAIWVAGGVLLALDRRWREAGVWAGAALGAGLLFFWGFTVNPQHPLPGVADLGTTLRFWLTLVGGAPAIGDLGTAPWAGAAMLAALGWIALRRPGGERRRRLAFSIACFGIVALAMVAYGRTHVSAGFDIPSRYYVLSALVLAMVLWVAVEHWLEARDARPVYAAGAFAGLACFNLLASAAFEGRGADFRDDRAAAVARYRATGSLDTAGPFKLYPKPAHAEKIVAESTRRGVYRFPVVNRQVRLKAPRETGEATYYFDEVSTGNDGVFIRGWAVRKDVPSERGAIHLILRSGDRLVAFRPISRKRRDIVAALGRPDVEFSGFLIQLPRSALPVGSYQIGVGFKDGMRVTYTMTGHRVEIPDTADRPMLASVVLGATE